MASLDGVELDPENERVITDRTRVGGSQAEGLKVGLAGSSQVSVVDGGERDQLNRVDLDLAFGHAVAAAGLHLRSAPQPERDCDLAGQHLSP